MNALSGVLAAGLALLSLAAPASTQRAPAATPRTADRPAPTAPERTVIAPELVRAMDEAGAEERLEVYLVMREQLDGRRLGAEAAAATEAPRARRRHVADRLRAHAAASQTEVRAVLERAVAQGRAARVRPLWIGNAVVFEAGAATIRELSRLPGVDRIRLVVDEGPEVYQDLGTPAPGVGVYPFADDFESGTLLPHWTVELGGQGYTAVTSANGPEGSFHLVMASAVDGIEGTASVTVQLDLAGQTDVGIRFRHKEFGDENHAADGVFVSPDGVVWHQVLALQNGSLDYETKVIQLDPIAGVLGFAYTSDFRVRFQWSDNFDIPTDGFAFDDIVIGPGAGAPPPPEPEPNIEALQAPQLWDIGYDGAGVLLGNIDSGVAWTHPDLIGRIWTNPADPANGLDDDGNGHVDDLHGWDFIHDDADVTSGDVHGTHTSGLAVGDGTSGRITGMAPGATMVACEVSSETSYWLAQQYLLDLGVDVITSSYSYKWPSTPKPDYHMHRQICAMELAAGVAHANSIGNQGGLLASHPIPFNVSAPGNCPGPFLHPEDEPGGTTSILACGGIKLPADAPYLNSGRGPPAWEDVAIYVAGYPHAQDPALWDYPYGGFGGSQPGLIKPDLVTYTDSVVTTTFGTGYASFGGTSAATPQLGGALCLLRQVQPAAEPRHLSAALQLTAVDLGPAGKDNQYGAGKVAVFAAARRLVVLMKAVDPALVQGGTVTLELYGQPNAFVHAFLSGGIEANGTSWNLIQPHVPLGVFALDGLGRETLVFAVPDDPALTGIEVWLQVGHQVQGADWGSGVLTSVPERLFISG